MKIILPPLLAALLLLGCLESNPQPSPEGKGDNFNGGADINLAEDDALLPPGADTVDHGEDTVAGGDMAEPADGIEPTDIADAWDVNDVGSDAETWDGYETWDIPETWDGYETLDIAETWDTVDIADLFETWDIADVPDVVPLEGTAVLGGGSSFGECMGACKADLTLDGAAIRVVRSGWDDTIYTDNTGVLTTAGLDQSVTLAEALIGVELLAVYGCPDCADGGAKYATLLLDGVPSTHAWEFPDTPPALQDVDLFLFEVMDALLSCTLNALVTPDIDCVPAG